MQKAFQAGQGRRGKHAASEVTRPRRTLSNPPGPLEHISLTTVGGGSAPLHTNLQPSYCSYHLCPCSPSALAISAQGRVDHLPWFTRQDYGLASEAHLSVAQGAGGPVKQSLAVCL